MELLVEASLRKLVHMIVPEYSNHQVLFLEGWPSGLRRWFAKPEVPKRDPQVRILHPLQRLLELVTRIVTALGQRPMSRREW